VLATNQYDALTPISKPPIDLTARYYDSAPGPAYPCGAGSYGLAANFFETNTVVNDVSAGDRSLLPNSDYACIVPGLGSLVWDYNPTGPGTLTIEGTVFIDGNALFDNFQLVDVQGSGTIYASGNVRFLSGVNVCGKWDVAASTCDWATWSPDDGLLFVVAAQRGAGTTLNLDANVRFQGGLWADQTLDVNSSAIAQGPQIARYISYNSQTGSLIVPFGTLPPGAPAVPTWEVVPIPGTWLEL
jgi:hypothetical protein